MSTETLSDGFQKLYCDAAVFDSFSALHPISFKRVLPFRSQDLRMDDRNIVDAEVAYLANKNDDAKRRLIAAYSRCGLLAEADAATVNSVIDFFDADFFDLMGMVYANAGMFICALRWYREYIAELEEKTPSELEDVYASVGYCLYSLGLFAEAISWTKSCIGPQVTADVIFRALTVYEKQLLRGADYAIERSIDRARYTVWMSDATRAGEAVLRLKEAMNILAPFQETYVGWSTPDRTSLTVLPGDYPFHLERGGNLLRHKMNLLFATCGQADALTARGCVAEAKRLLDEAAIIEPNADFIQERIQALR